jgi:hypothetical protein
MICHSVCAVKENLGQRLSRAAVICYDIRQRNVTAVKDMTYDRGAIDRGDKTRLMG